MRPGKLTVLVTFALLITGCNPVPKYARPGALAKWQNQAPAPAVADRQLASLPADACWSHGSSPEVLRAEILQMEAAAHGPAVQGTWPPAGIDLRSLPRAQALYLLAHSARLPDRVSYRGCGDLVCVLNRAFGQPDSDPTGVYVYWWYLNTGMVVSAVPFVTASSYGREWSCSEEALSLEEQRFSPQEIRRLVDIARALPDGWARGAQGQVLYRFRRGYKPIRTAESCRTLRDGARECLACRSSAGAQACGVPLNSSCASNTSAVTFFGLQDSRFIIETDTGLTLARRYNGPQASLLRDLEGYSWFGVTHEFTHLLDSPLDAHGDYVLSNSDEWLRLTGFGWSTVVQRPSGSATRSPVPVQSPRPRSISRWEGDNYAATSPTEDLAVTASYARFDAERTASTVPEKASFVSRRIFGGRSFTPEGLGATYRERIANELHDLVPQWIERCRAQPGSAAGDSMGIPILDAFPSTFRGCLAREFSGAYRTSLAGLKVREMEACEWLAQREAGLRSQVLQALRARFEALLSREDAAQMLVAAERDLHEALRTQLDPREVLQSCWASDEPSREDCFRARLETAFDAVAARFRDRLGSTFTTRRSAYLNEHSYAQTLDSTLLAYRSWFAGVESQIESVARARWERCNSESLLDAAASTGTPLLEPFNGGPTFVDPRILDCLNGGALDEIRQLRERTTGAEFSLSSDGARQFVETQLLLPLWVSTLSGHLNDAASAETARMEVLASGLQRALAASLLNDLSWANSAFGNDAFHHLCTARVLADPLLEQVSGSTQNLRYVSLDEWRGTLTRQVCREAAENASVRARLQENRERFASSLRDLDARLQRASQAIRIDCQRIIPSSTASAAAVQNARRSCFDQRWLTNAEQVWEEWNRARTGTEFFTSALETSRRGLWSYLAERVRTNAISSM